MPYGASDKEGYKIARMRQMGRGKGEIKVRLKKRHMIFEQPLRYLGQNAQWWNFRFIITVQNFLL